MREEQIAPSVDHFLASLLHLMTTRTHLSPALILPKVLTTMTLVVLHIAYTCGSSFYTDVYVQDHIDNVQG